MPDAVVFDCDGVLVDSERAWFVGIVNVFDRHGVRELRTGPGSRLYGASVHDVVDVLEAELAEPLDRGVLAEEVYDAICRAIEDGVEAMEGAVDLLAALEGSLPLAVASNGSTRTVEAALRVAGLPDVFDAVVAFSPPIRPKPAPDLYLRACELLAVAPERALALEDSVPGATAARAAGLTVVGVGDAAQLGPIADLVVPTLRDRRLLALLGLEEGGEPPVSAVGRHLAAGKPGQRESPALE